VLGIEVMLNGRRLCSASGGVQGGVRVQVVTEVITTVPGWEKAVAELEVGGWSEAWSGRREFGLWLCPAILSLQVGDTVVLRMTDGADADPPRHREDAAAVVEDSAEELRHIVRRYVGLPIADKIRVLQELAAELEVADAEPGAAADRPRD
jgi:hypothetical protein